MSAARSATGSCLLLSRQHAESWSDSVLLVCCGAGGLQEQISNWTAGGGNSKTAVQALSASPTRSASHYPCHLMTLIAVTASPFHPTRTPSLARLLLASSGSPSLLTGMVPVGASTSSQPALSCAMPRSVAARSPPETSALSSAAACRAAANQHLVC